MTSRVAKGLRYAFNKRVLNLAGSFARSESHLLCVVIGCSPLMSHIHVHALH